VLEWRSVCRQVCTPSFFAVKHSVTRPAPQQLQQTTCSLDSLVTHLVVTGNQSTCTVYNRIIEQHLPRCSGAPQHLSLVLDLSSLDQPAGLAS
jgi:hypothetical protein